MTMSTQILVKSPTETTSLSHVKAGDTIENVKAKLQDEDTPDPEPAAKSLDEPDPESKVVVPCSGIIEPDEERHNPRAGRRSRQRFRKKLQTSEHKDADKDADLGKHLTALDRLVAKNYERQLKSRVVHAWMEHVEATIAQALAAAEEYESEASESHVSDYSDFDKIWDELSPRSQAQEELAMFIEDCELPLKRAGLRYDGPVGKWSSEGADPPYLLPKIPPIRSEDEVAVYHKCP